MNNPAHKGKFSSPFNPMGRPRMEWIAAHLDYQGDDCLIYPFSRGQNGYAWVGSPGHAFYLHRFMCERHNGPPPTSKHHAAHSCGRGDEGCVNPRHLSWKTNAENQHDRLPQGKRSKLTPEQVIEIRGLKDIEQSARTAARFGISEVNVRQIQAGKIWRQDRLDRHHFTEAEVLAIRAQKSVRGSSGKLAAQYGVSAASIRCIQRGDYYRWVFPSTKPGTSP